MNAASIALVTAMLGGCASGSMPSGDTGVGFDALVDSGTSDTGSPPSDTGMDVPDTGMADTAVPLESGTCEACADNDECAAGSLCVNLTEGGMACVPQCNPDLPDCPRGFNCVIDILAGTDLPVCLPVGAPCCVDEDADEYGRGVGCMGIDCDDEDDAVYEGAPELCNGADDDCDGTADEPPTDCVSGRCGLVGPGSPAYEAIADGSCVSAMCDMGTTTDCGLSTCEGGGDDGDVCASTCAPMGTDDDGYCIAGAHCESGACAMDVPNGSACDEDSDCDSAHCDNGFCCTTGVCCASTSDCPGGGGVTRLCDTPMTCQGSRGESECVASACQVMSGIADDTACGTTTMALDCGLYDDIFCTGAPDQTAPSCPTSCSSDTDCVDSAHCEVGSCVPDRPIGGVCARDADCQMALSCADGRCCTSACVGECLACDLPGMEGVCAPIPAGTDPDTECAGFSCAGHFVGFAGGSDMCYRRSDVSDSAATCNGGGACISPATLCPSQPQGALQIDCDNACQDPAAGTCAGTTAGVCVDLDDAAITTTCGVGECMSTVQACVGGTPMSCTPGSPSPEVCNGLDDDCDGTADDGTAADLCPSAPFTAGYMCTAMGDCTFTCQSGRHDLNGTYADGCECQDDASAGTCPAATALGILNAGGTISVSGAVFPDSPVDWYQVSFPNTGRGPSNGQPRIRLTGPTAGNFVIDAYRSCGGPEFGASDTAASSLGLQEFVFIDDQSFGTTAYSGPHTTGWPSGVLVAVRRVGSTMLCSEAAYTLTITR